MRRAVGVVLACAAAVTGACVDSTGPDASLVGEVQLIVVGPMDAPQGELQALAQAFDVVDRYRVRVEDVGMAVVLADTTVAVVAGGGAHALDVELPGTLFGRSVDIDVVGYRSATATAPETEMYRSSTRTVLASAGLATVALQVRYTGPGIRGRVVDANDNGIPGTSMELWSDSALVTTRTTVADGSFLFLDVEPGMYRLVPELATGSSAPCPGVREIAVVAPTDRRDAEFVVGAAECRTSVLVLASGDVDETDLVADALGADTTLSVSAFFLTDTLPAAYHLDRHDVVLLFANGIADAAPTLGDRVADYLDRGGNVVLASFHWEGYTETGLGADGWGRLEAFDPFLPDDGGSAGAVTLGEVSVHPLTDGLTTLSADGSRGAVNAAVGTDVVAAWSDEVPLLGYRLLSAGQRVVGVGLYPASGPDVAGDAHVLWRNAVRWAGAPGGPN